MNRKPAEQHRALSLLVKALGDRNNKRKRELGIQGIQALGTSSFLGSIDYYNRSKRFDFDQTTRHAALRELLTRHGDTPELFPSSTSKYPFLVALLRADDDTFFQNMISQEAGPASKAIQAFLLNWVTLLKDEHKGVSHELLDKLCGIMDHPLYNAGTATAISHSIEMGDEEHLRKFFQRFPALYDGAGGFQGDAALSSALKKDHGCGFQFTIKMLDSLKEYQKEKDIVAKVGQHLDSHLGKQITLSDGLPERRDDPMTRNNPDVYEGYLVPLSKAYLERAKLRNKEGAFPEAEVDVMYSLDIKPDRYEAHEFRGDLNLRWKWATEEGIKGAIKEYQQAIKDLPDEKAKIQRASLYKKLGLACARLFKEYKDEANKAFDEAEQNYLSADDKARVNECRGLLYLLDEKWDKAFENSNKIDKAGPWNWLIRYIAAKEANKSAAEIREAEKKWEGSTGSATVRAKNLVELSYYIPKLLKKHLGVSVHAERFRRLSGKPAGAIEASVEIDVENGKSYDIDLVLDNVIYDVKLRGKDREKETKPIAANNTLRYVATDKGRYRIVVTSPGAQGLYWLVIREYDKGN
jgi:hypothetical protein